MFQQLGPRPSDFIVAPDWVSEDADMTKAFGGRSHRPWNFEFPGARYWPRADDQRPELHLGRQTTGRAMDATTKKGHPAEYPSTPLISDGVRPFTVTDANLLAARRHEVAMANKMADDNYKMTLPNGRPVNFYADGPLADVSYVQQTRYLPFIDALRAPNYSLNTPNSLASSGKAAFSRYLAPGQRNGSISFLTKHHYSSDIKPIRYSM